MDEIAHTVTNGGECKFRQAGHHPDAAGETPVAPARDANQLAKRVADVATGLESDIPLEPKGEQISAPARATSLMPERRREVGRKAAAAR